MFFVVQVACLAATFVLYLMLRGETQPIHLDEKTKVTNFVPTYLLLGLIGLLIIASFIPNTHPWINGMICMALMIVGIIYEMIAQKDVSVLKNTLKKIDFFTLLLLSGLFVVIAGITEAGVIDWLANGILHIGGDNLFVMYTIIVWISVILSAFIDNIPYVATMLPVVQLMATTMGVNPTFLYFGLLSGATLGGNLTPIGASANITALGLLRKEGHDAPNSTFMKISVPYTLAAFIVGYILIWVLYKPM